MDPIAIEIGGLAIYWYGILVATGFLAGLWTAGRRAHREGISSERIVDLGPWIIIGALVGARLLYVITFWEEQFAQAPNPFWEMFKIRDGGLVFYGGLIGALLCTVGYIKWKGLALWKVADILAPSIALGHGFGRLGCLMTGCCYGKACSLPWAIHFPEEHATGGIGVHPTQIYSSLLNFGLYAGLAWLFRRKQFDGQVFAVYLVGYSILRFGVEMFRGDYPTYYLGDTFTPAQLISILLLGGGLLLFWKLRSPGSVPASQSNAK